MSTRVILPPHHATNSASPVPGGWWHTHPTDANRIVCDLCPRECSLSEGDRGFCFVREHQGGQMVLSTYGLSSGFCIDPIEKKPLNHFYPGTSVLSFGTAGCNLGCKFCQNWSISKSREVERSSQVANPEMIAQAAKTWGCHSVAFTYNDPVVWAEYAIDVARVCRAQCIRTVAVTAGYISAEAREPFFSNMDAANVDLKAFTEKFYQQMTLSHLQPVLETLQWLTRESDVWLEITNLVIPQENDDDDELRRMCDWIVSHLGVDVPIHFSAFHPDFRLQHRPATPQETLLRAHAIATNAGIRYVYVGNVHDIRHQSTYCHGCGSCLIERDWYELGKYGMEGPRCGSCQTLIPGRFAAAPGNWGRRRVPIDMARFRPTLLNTIDMNPRENSSVPNSPPPSQEATACSLDLTPAQSRLLLRTAAYHVASAAGRIALALEDPSLAGLAHLPVIGCFVTLKRQHRLRACCGFLGQSMELQEALAHAAVTTATRDERFAPIAARELSDLDLTISLLHSLHPVLVPAHQRASVVEVGRHGLQIQHAGKRGLLLPNVAIEQGFDAENFLRQVCLKANLSADAWRDPQTSLFTFESTWVESPFPHDIAAHVADRSHLPLTDRQWDALVTFVRTNFATALRGAAPACFLIDGVDGMVAGISLQVYHTAETADPHEPIWQDGAVSLRPGLPLQSTLARLIQNAAHALRLSAVDQDRLRVELSVLYDAVPRGTTRDYDDAHWDTSCEAALVISGDQFAWCLQPNQVVAALVDWAQSLAAPMHSAPTLVCSARLATTRSSHQFSNAPVPVITTTPRRAAMAGKFYPDDPAQLQQACQQLLAPYRDRRRQTHSAAMVPHAGWQYSGHLVAQVLSQLQIPPRIVVLGPKHTRLGANWAVAPHSAWQFPGGELAADTQLAQHLAANIPGLQLDAAAHSQEHGIEVLVPLIASLAPASRLTGIVIGRADLPACLAFARQLHHALQHDSVPTLLLISSDMNHFANDQETRRLDRMAIDALEAGDPTRLFQVVREQNISMCGLLPAVMVLACLAQQGSSVIGTSIGYQTSADVNGDTSRVVGYSGMTFDPAS